MPIPPQGSIHCCRSKKSGDLVFIGSPLFVFIGCALRNMVKNSLRFWRSWLHLQRCCIIFSMTIIKRNNRPSVQLGGYFITILVGADRFRCALSIFIIRIFLRFVKGQTGVFFGYAVLTIFGRVCYNHKQSALERVHILYSAVESCSRKGVIAMTWMEFLTLCNVVCDIILILQNSNKRK